jgi:hypothetical protein
MVPGRIVDADAHESAEQKVVVSRSTSSRSERKESIRRQVAETS